MPISLQRKAQYRSLLNTTKREAAKFRKRWKRPAAEALFVKTDVSDHASVDAMAQAALAKFGRIDCLINNAAVFSRITMAPFWKLPLDEWRRAMDVNITGAFLCARAVVPTMQERGWGRIINVCSGTVIMGRENYLHYVTSKSAAIGMTRAMARELGCLEHHGELLLAWHHQNRGRETFGAKQRL